MVRRFVYAATETTDGTELWITDGTAAGTSLLKDLAPGIANSNPSDFVSLGDGRVLFTALVGGDTDARQLWITDGTSAGTHTVRTENWLGFYPASLHALGTGRAVFSADRGSGSELWITDGTDAGTAKLKEINPTYGSRGAYGSYPSGFIEIGAGRLLFQADDGTHGSELWVTDGTASGTSLLKDIAPGANGAGFVYGTEVGGKVVFLANDGSDGAEPWVTDGTAAGTMLLADLYLGGNGSQPGDFFSLGNGRAVFSALLPGSGKRGLYVTDGTPGGTALINSQAGTSAAYFASLGDGRAVFEAIDNTFNAYTSPPTGTFYRTGLWVTDGTAAGTRVISYTDYLHSPLTGVAPFGPTVSLGNGRALFVGLEGTGSIGYELYVTDGNGVSLVKDINTTPNGPNTTANGSSNPDGLYSLGDGRALFRAFDGTTQSLWISDGTTAGTMRLNTGRVGGDYSSSYYASTFGELIGANQAPVAAADAYAVRRGQVLTAAASRGVLANDTDADGNPLTAKLVSGPQHGTVALNPSGAFTYTPAAGYVGADSFTYKANDGQADSAATQVSLAIRPNSGPDFNADGTGDLVLQNGGTVVDWLLQGGAYQSGNTLTTGAAGFTVMGKGDFNADGTTDLVLQNGGTVVDWLLKDGAYQTGNVITTGAAGFTVVGTGDFNGDGTTDILLQNGGTVVEWLMKDGAYQSGGVITNGAGGFAVVGTGDLNGDGTTDILLQSGGTVVDWLMKDGAYQSGGVITNGAAGFTVVGTGDFDADGTDDVVLQNGGTVVDWLMRDGAYVSGTVLTTGADGYAVRATGDYNGDGTTDIALQGGAGGGTVVDWIMQNGAYASGTVITTGATGFTIR